MTDFSELLAERERTKRCGTQTTWDPPAPKNYLVTFDPIPQDVIRALWPDLETAK